MDNADVYLTVEGRARLEEELHRLIHVERPAVASLIELARELGDLSENADYEVAKNEQAFLEGRIALIEHQLHNAVMIDTDVSSSTVVLGSHVTVLDPDGEKLDFVIVGHAESNPAMHHISNESPLGRALMGCEAGVDVLVKAPAGELTYRLESVG